MLEPLEKQLAWEVRGYWMDNVERTFDTLSKTFSESVKNDSIASKSIADFWMNILMVGDGFKYGPSGVSKRPAKEYNGWIIDFLTGRPSILIEDMKTKRIMKKFSGLNEVEMKVTLTYLDPQISDMSTLQAGIMGFELHKETFNDVPSVKPHHMWALNLPANSPLRR